jgi:hypothetical protein
MANPLAIATDLAAKVVATTPENCPAELLARRDAGISAAHDAAWALSYGNSNEPGYYVAQDGSFHALDTLTEAFMTAEIKRAMTASARPA